VKCRCAEFRKHEGSKFNGKWENLASAGATLKFKSWPTHCKQDAHADEPIVDIHQRISMESFLPTSPFRYFAFLEETVLWEVQSRLLERF
jgi:hypothetical protein